MPTTAKTRILYAHWLILGTALLFIAGFGALHSYQEHHRARHNEEERLMAQARAVQENVAHHLRTVRAVLIKIRSDLPADAGSKEFSAQLKTLTDAMPAVRTLTVADADGKVVASSRPELAGIDISKRAYFRTVQQKPDSDILYISSPFQTSLGVYTITLSTTIPGQRGRFAGIVTATLDPDYFSILLDSVRYTPDMRASIVHWGGTRFIVRPDQVSGGMDLSKPGTFFSLHRDSGKEATVYSGLVYATGDERIIAQRTIRPDGFAVDQPLVAAVNRRLDGIYATWREEMRMMVAFYLAFTAVAVAGLVAYQRKHFELAAKEAEAVRIVEDNERFMKAVADHIPGMVAYWNRDLRCRFSNAAYLEWFGKTPEQMRGIRIRDLLGEDLFHKNETYILGALRGEPQVFERTLTKADGSTGYTLAQYIPDKDGDKVNGFVVLVSDVTRLKEAEVALSESEWKLKTIIEAEPECVALLSADSTVLQMNRAGLDMLGADSEEEIIGKRLADMVDLPYQTAFSELSSEVAQRRSGSLTLELTGRKGVHRWLEMNAVPMPGKAGRQTEVLCVIRDITGRKKAEMELERLARLDFLTGLANRRHFMELAEQELLRTHRYGGGLSVMMIDIDHFKQINDSYGHNTGDMVIKAFAGLCQQAMRSVDIVGRLGGEEFGVVLPQTDGQQALEAAERLCELVAKAGVPVEGSTPVHFTVSIGVATLEGTDASVETLLNQADTALYEAKNAGRNKVCGYRRQA